MTPLPESITAATRRLIDTVDSLADAEFVQPSLLPGWTVGHVVSHLVLNAEAITRVLRGVARGERPTMYADDAARDTEIADLAGEDDPEELRIRLSVGSAFLDGEIAMLDPRHDDLEIERTPGGISFRVGALPLMRLREVEIHHADLGVGTSHADWPEENVVRFLDHSSTTYRGVPFTAEATDLGRSWDFAGGGPVVSGVGSALAWWSTGRSAEGLTSEGDLPRIEGR